MGNKNTEEEKKESEEDVVEPDDSIIREDSVGYQDLRNISMGKSAQAAVALKEEIYDSDTANG